MNVIIQALLAVALGLGLGIYLGPETVSKIPALSFYDYFIFGFLGIGLYGSVYLIDTDLIRKNARQIVTIIITRVMFKLAIIGVGGWFWRIGLLAPIVGQIDPIATAALMQTKNKRLSSNAQAILRTWSAFDDPITVLVGVYVAYPLLTGGNLSDIATQYPKYLLLNLGFAATIYIVKRWVVKEYEPMKLALLAIALAVAIWGQYMLGLALIGLFLRPSLDRVVEWAVKISYWASACVFGIFLSKGINPFEGTILGLFAVASQILVSIPSFSIGKLTRKDRVYLGIAQFDGITAITLAIFFESAVPGVVAIVAMAVLVINTLHVINRAIADKIYQSN